MPELADGWGTTVYPSGVYFSLVLGLDVVQPALSKAEIVDVEERLAEVADWYWEHRDGAWPSSRYGAYGVWAVYTGNEERLRTGTSS